MAYDYELFLPILLFIVDCIWIEQRFGGIKKAKLTEPEMHFTFANLKITNKKW